MGKERPAVKTSWLWARPADARDRSAAYQFIQSTSCIRDFVLLPDA